MFVPLHLETKTTPQWKNTFHPQATHQRLGIHPTVIRSFAVRLPF
jgi:hypothetical protein